MNYFILTVTKNQEILLIFYESQYKINEKETEGRIMEKRKSRKVYESQEISDYRELLEMVGKKYSRKYCLQI